MIDNVFFTSDTHWFHSNIIRYSKRPYSSAKEMNEAFVKNWNATVSPNDVVWHLGDVSFGLADQTVELLKRLNGRKHLVLGNHDQVITRNIRLFMQPGCFESIQPYKELRLDPLIVLFHYGQRVWNKSHRGSIMLYGHSHGSLPPHGKSVDVGVDSKEITHEYRPYSLKEILGYMSKREIAKVDHHGD